MGEVTKLPYYLVKAIRKYAIELVFKKTGLARDGKPYCKYHRVYWDEAQFEEADCCQDCGRTRPEHRNQLEP